MKFKGGALMAEGAMRDCRMWASEERMAMWMACECRSVSCDVRKSGYEKHYARLVVRNTRLPHQRTFQSALRPAGGRPLGHLSAAMRATPWIERPMTEAG